MPYPGKTKITDDTVETLFQLSPFLQVAFLAKACSDFLIKSLNSVPKKRASAKFDKSKPNRKAAITRIL